MGWSSRAPFAKNAKSAALLKRVRGLNGFRCESLAMSSVYTPPAVRMWFQTRGFATLFA